MITKIGNDLIGIEKDANWFTTGVNKLWNAGRAGVRGLSTLAEQGAKGLTNGYRTFTPVEGASRLSNTMGRAKSMASNAGTNVQAAWKRLGGVKGAQAATAGAGMVGAGYLAFGGSKPATNNYNFYNANPQQFSGSWQ